MLFVVRCRSLQESEGEWTRDCGGLHRPRLEQQGGPGGCRCKVSFLRVGQGDWQGTCGIFIEAE